ncbi:imelysin family protein [Pusillimonas noertemannii]|uniref:Imelysin-like domain-containing protein n=1 Tax=Pusillimonas noertemannii TaxID=305977 RepID=A0A2U1CLR2_9BURK|nr:imelysin family protein [Pusillimonas noertemannii]PVY61959.1 hypothetical protein C7440_1445 [Pusillimonas noertemannii]TFL11031.1 aminopeptidase [Pusillimonas noertemannii]
MIKQWMGAAVLALAWTMPGMAVAQTAAESASGLGARLAQGYIAPAMQQFHEAAGQMGKALQSACGDPAAGSDEVAAAFEHLVAAWSGIEFLRFGPLVQANRFESIYFWPDPRGVTTRQVQGLLAKPAGEIPDAQGLAKHSVALQGLPALEYVLYRDKGLLSGKQGDDQAAACAYALAVAGNLERVGGELYALWKADGEFARLFSQPGPDNPLYRNAQEVAAEVVKALSTGLQFQVDVKLAPSLGADAGKAAPRKAPFWRSDLAPVSLRAAAQGMLAFYDAGGYSFPGAEWIDQNVRGELQRAVDQLEGMRGGTEQLWRDEESHRGLVLVRLLLNNAKNLVDQDVAPALGVRIGFNALDGD